MIFKVTLAFCFFKSIYSSSDNLKCRDCDKPHQHTCWWTGELVIWTLLRCFIKLAFSVCLNNHLLLCSLRLKGLQDVCLPQCSQWKDTKRLWSSVEPPPTTTATIVYLGKGSNEERRPEKWTFLWLYCWNTFAFSSSKAPNDEMIKPVISRDNWRLGARKFKQHSKFPFYPWSPSFADVGWLADVFGLRGSLKQLWFPQQLVVCRDREE